MQTNQQKTLEQVSRALNSLPHLTMGELTNALSHANLAISEEKQAAMFDALAVAFRNYFVMSLGEVWSSKDRAAPLALKLNQIAGVLKRAERALGLIVINDVFSRPADDKILAHLALQANWAAPKPNGWPDLPPFNFSTQDPDSKQYTKSLDYRGEEKVSQCLEALALLSRLAERAHAFQRSKVATKDKSARHKGDAEMKSLIAAINGTWSEAFGRQPRVSWDGEHDKAAGPYVRFVWTLFHKLADRVPADLAQEYPRLKSGLELTEDAIRARFKRSATPRIRALARKMAR